MPALDLTTVFEVILLHFCNFGCLGKGEGRGCSFTISLFSPKARCILPLHFAKIPEWPSL